MYVCMYLSIYLCIYACMHGCMYACIHTCMHGCMHACMHAWMYVRTYLRTYHCRGIWGPTLLARQASWSMCKIMKALMALAATGFTLYSSMGVANIMYLGRGIRRKIAIIWPETKIPAPPCSAQKKQPFQSYNSWRIILTYILVTSLHPSIMNPLCM